MAAPLLHAQNIGHAFSGRPLFDQLNCSIHEGDRIGLIGSNGSGKSTLMQILTGRFEPDEGSVIRRQGLKIAYVTQSPEYDLADRAIDVMEKSLAETGISELERVVIANTWLSQSGFDNPEVQIKALSGGWRKRLQIIAAASQDADVMLLDEPTNHLDMKGVEWLEELLSQQIKTWVTISHDRYFLQRTVNKIFEIDTVYPEGIFEVDGAYGDFLRRKSEFLAAQEQYASSLASRVRREEAWLARGPKARTTKAKGRIDQAHGLQRELAEVRDRMRTESTKIQFSDSGRKTKKLIELSHVSKAIEGKALFSDLEFIVRPKGIIGILGDNGSGKTTLLRVMAEELKPDQGDVKHAQDLKIVYFDQHRDTLDLTWNLKRALCDSGGDSVVFQGRSVHVVTWAKRFNFRPEQLDIPVGDLSGGERARVVIARLMAREADVLLLDEPTNDLDIQTIEVLEDSLDDFKGAIVLVTHDRYMLNTLCNEFIGLLGDGIVRQYASYDQWFNEKKDLARANSKPVRKQEEKGSRKKNSSKKLGYIEQREYDGMEEQIMDAETALAEWEEKVNDPTIATQSEKLKEACAELDKCRAGVQKLYDRWAELESKKDG